MTSGSERGRSAKCSVKVQAAMTDETAATETIVARLSSAESETMAGVLGV